MIMLMATEAWVALTIAGAAVLMAIAVVFAMFPMLRRYMNMRRM